MLIKESQINIIDNSNFKVGRCIHIFGGSQTKVAGVGSFILVSVRSNLKKKKLRTKVYLAVIAAVCFNIRRQSGNFIRFEKNTILLFSDKENLLGTKLFGAVNFDLRKHSLLRVPLLGRSVI